jgi:Putative Ig domain
MSEIGELAALANLTTVNPENNMGAAFPMQGCISFGPVALDSDAATNGFIFGLEIDQHFREAGWTLVGKNGAAGSMDFPLGIPNDAPSYNPTTGHFDGYPNDAPLFETIWTSGGQPETTVRTYNPYLFTIQSTTWEHPTNFGFQVAIPEGPTSAGTLSAIAGAMKGQGFTPVFISPTTYYLTWPIDDYAGQFANERGFSSNGFFGTAGNMKGAGKTYESQVLNGMKFRVNFASTEQDYDGNIAVSVTVFLASGGTFVSVGTTQTTIMMSQPDYIFYLDPYSMYITSVASTFHADLYQTSQFLVAMIDTSAAVPQHASPTVANMPPMAVMSGMANTLEAIGGTPWWIGNTTFSSPVWGFPVIRSPAQPLFNNDGSDVMDSARVIVQVQPIGNYTLDLQDTLTTQEGLLAARNSTPIRTVLIPHAPSIETIFPTITFTMNSYAGGSGPLTFVGRLWNTLMDMRDYGAIHVPYTPDVPDPVPTAELLLPKTYYSAFHQSGGEEIYDFDGSPGTVMLGPVDYDYFDLNFNVEINPMGGPLGIKVLSESNLFANLASADGASFSLVAIGGTPVFYNGNPADTVPPDVVWTYNHLDLPPNWAQQPTVGYTNAITFKAVPEPGYVGTWLIPFTATDQAMNTTTVQYRLVVGPSTVVYWSNNTMCSGLVGIPYYAEGGGSAGQSWSVGSGFPPGLSLDPNIGTISGIPTSSGIFDFTISITGPGAISRSFQLTIDNP